LARAVQAVMHPFLPGDVFILVDRDGFDYDDQTVIVLHVGPPDANDIMFEDGCVNLLLLRVWRDGHIEFQHCNFGLDSFQHGGWKKFRIDPQ
jgi:hypothetical protein